MNRFYYIWKKKSANDVQFKKKIPTNKIEIQKLQSKYAEFLEYILYFTQRKMPRNGFNYEILELLV